MPGVVAFSADEPVEKMLRILKKQVERAGLMYDLKKKEYYSKPSVRKTIKSREARRRANKERKKASKE